MTTAELKLELDTLARHCDDKDAEQRAVHACLTAILGALEARQISNLVLWILPFSQRLLRQVTRSMAARN